MSVMSSYAECVACRNFFLQNGEVFQKIMEGAGDPPVDEGIALEQDLYQDRGNADALNESDQIENNVDRVLMENRPNELNRIGRRLAPNFRRELREQNVQEDGSETTNNTEDDEQMDISDDPDNTTDQAVPASTGIEEEEEDDDEDRYKPEGSVSLDIDRFSDFARANTVDNNQRLSAPVYIRGLPWKILAIPRDASRSPLERRSGKALGFFLQCNGDCQDTSWSCPASAQLRIVSVKSDVQDNVRRISHTFYAKENDWGYSQFVNCETLLDPENGYIANDTVRLMVTVSADAPHGVQWDSKKHAGHIGLKNQGATCYMNSILQTLFFTNKLRKAVYQMPTEDDDPDSSVALAMQRVFFELQFSNQPVGTKKADEILWMGLGRLVFTARRSRTVPRSARQSRIENETDCCSGYNPFTLQGSHEIVH
jgi:hypothetical protein